jgi:glycosyltransferase involved in cell wall biosynthesis
MKDDNRAKKHIAMYIGSLQRGGAERVMVNLAEYLWSAGWRVTFVTTYIAHDEYELPHAAWKVTGDLDTGGIGSDPLMHDIGSVTDRLAFLKQNRGTATDESESACKTSGISENGSADTPSDIVMARVCDTESDYICVDLHGGLKGGIDRIFSAAQDSKAGRIRGFMLRFDTLADIWKRLKPDIILSFLGKNNIMSILTAKDLNIPVVVSVRAKPSEEYCGRLMKLSMNYTFPRAAGVVLQTEGAAAFFSDKIRKKVTILPNSINPSFIKTPFTGVRDKTIVTVGRLDDNKNQEMLIRAFAQICAACPDWQVHLYGDGPSRDRLEKLTAGLGITDKVIFMGQSSDIPGKIFRAGIFVLTSDTEGMPNSLIEAMSLGIPCVSTDCPFGPSELIRPHENGELVPVRDTEALGKVLADLMQHRDRADAMGREASKIQKLYSPDMINRRWEQYLQSIGDVKKGGNICAE